MDVLAQRVLKGLLLQSSFQGEQLLPFLPIQFKQQLSSLPTPELHDQKQLFHNEDELKFIHYSWIFPHFKSFSSVEQELYFSILSNEQRKGLESLLKSSVKTIELPSLTALYFSKKLYQQVVEGKGVSSHLLPPSKLSILLTLKKQQLVLLIDFLGLYDLAIETRQIVDKRVLNKIMLAMTEEQKTFLAYCQKQPQRWKPPKLNLTQWNGDAKTLNLLLHHRGLFRFAHAFTNETHDLLELIEYRLDIGRGQSLEKYFNVKVDDSAVATFHSQVLQLAERFNRPANP